MKMISEESLHPLLSSIQMFILMAIHRLESHKNKHITHSTRDYIHGIPFLARNYLSAVHDLALKEDGNCLNCSISKLFTYNSDKVVWDLHKSSAEEG